MLDDAAQRDFGLHDKSRIGQGAKEVVPRTAGHLLAEKHDL